jgi:hypothetical protein
MEALKIVTHIINRVPSKSAPKTRYELWTIRKPSINYFHVWGCSLEAKIFNSQIGKLDPKTISCHYILISPRVINFILSKPYYQIYEYQTHSVLGV